MERETHQNGDSAEAEEHESPFAMMAGAQERIRDTQRRLDQMADDHLLAGASFSLGLAIGLFVSGASRLLVAVTLVPAAAMLTTLMNREREAAATGEASPARRRSTKTTSA